MATIHAILMISLFSLIIFSWKFDNRGKKLLSVQKFLRKTSRIVPLSAPKIEGEFRPKTRLKLACLILDEKGETKPFYTREKDLYPSPKPVLRQSLKLQKKERR